MSEKAEALWKTLADVCGRMSIGSDMSNVFDPIDAALRRARNEGREEAAKEAEGWMDGLALTDDMKATLPAAIRALKEDHDG